MGIIFKKYKEKLYIEMEQEIDPSDILSELSLDDVLNQFDHSEILDAIADKLIVEKAKEIHTFTVKEMLENYSLSELKEVVAKELLSR